MKKLWMAGRVGAVALAALLLVQGCTDLDENPRSLITPDNFYQTEEEVMGGVASIYAGLRATLWGYYNLSEISTDELIVPTRGNDWYDGGRWLEIHYQSWSPTNASGEDINGAWNDAFGAIARANVLLEVLPNIAVADKSVIEAEVRTLRAFYYYVLMDLFGGVPIVETTEIMPRERSTRTELFTFIENELLAAREELPDTWPANMHGRMTRGAANALLANMYLNAQVFTGTVDAGGLTPGAERWQDAVDAADEVINSGVYTLAADWNLNFAPENFTSPENILVIKHLAQSGFGFGNHFFYRAMHYNSGGGGAWNGFSTLAETYYAFDTASVQTQTVPGTSQTADILISDDLRHEIFLAGQHYNVETGEVVYDRANLPLFFTPTIGDETQAHEREGVRIYKWPIDPARAGTDNGNDYAIFRLADIYLIKAEALNELGQTATAIAQVNTVRERAFDPDQPLSTAMGQAEARDRIRRERLFELTAEGKRRQDLIRWGQFTNAWTHKEATEPFRILMPIPQTQMDANPSLKQNAGY